MDGGVIGLADGVYTGAGNRDVDFRGKAIRIHSLGGDPDACILDCAGGPAEQHRGFKFVSGEDSLPVLEGVKICNGYATGGGGLLCANTASPTIRNCILSGNTAEVGGAIAVYAPSAWPRFQSCRLIDNHAYLTGGGFHVNGGGATLAGCVVAGNAAEEGGGGFTLASLLQCTGCDFSQNSSLQSGGGISSQQGVLLCEGCAITDNAAGLSGGGLRVGLGSIGLAADASGGMLGWLDPDGDLYVMRIDGNGLPTFDAVLIQESTLSNWGHVAICRLGTNWLVAWGRDGGPPRYALLDEECRVLPPGIVHISQGSTWDGLAVCEAPGAALACLAWRGGDLWHGPVYAARVGAGGQLLEPWPIVLAQQAWAEYPNAGSQLHNIDCQWTGNHFLLLWNDYRYPWYPATYESFVRAQWLAPDGSLLFDEPLDVTSGTSPREMALGHVGRGFQCLSQDNYDHTRWHTMLVDSLGALIDPPSRFSGPLFLNDVLLSWLEPVAQSWRRAGLLGTVVLSARQTWRDSEPEPLYSACVEAHLVTPEGTRAHWISPVLGQERWTAAHSLDGVAYDDTILVATQEEVAPGTMGVCARLFLTDETELCAWSVASTGHELQPAVARTGDANLLVWSDGRTGVQQLYVEQLDRGSGQQSISGQPLFPSAGMQTQPRLAKGPDQCLCVFLMTVPGSATGVDVYALRLSPDGTPQDQEPILVCGQSGGQSCPWVVWDGFNYLVSWNGAGVAAVWANRVAANGSVLDADGFLVGSGVEGPGGGTEGRLASNGAGTVGVNLSGNRLRFIHEPEIAGVAMARRPARPVSLAAPQPNPSRGLVRLYLEATADVSCDVVDLAGRRVRGLPVPPGAGGQWISWDGCRDDGRSVPAGVYFIRAGAGSKTAVRRVTILR
jgi:predicted outer membrane repeat protein